MSVFSILRWPRGTAWAIRHQDALLIALACGFAAIVLRFSSGYVVAACRWGVMAGWLLVLLVFGTLTFRRGRHACPLWVALPLARGADVDMHMQALSSPRKEVRMLIPAMVELVADCETVGVSRINLDSLLLGPKHRRARTVSNLNTEFKQRGMAWVAVDEGSRTRPLVTAVYWLIYCSPTVINMRLYWDLPELICKLIKGELPKLSCTLIYDELQLICREFPELIHKPRRLYKPEPTDVTLHGRVLIQKHNV